jgi:hypothetical protein
MANTFQVGDLEVLVLSDGVAKTPAYSPAAGVGSGWGVKGSGNREAM